MFTPKQLTERLLATTYVYEEYVDVLADQIWFGLKNAYAPDVLVQLYWPEQFKNPVVTTSFRGVPLRTALENVASYCGVEMSVTDLGAIALKVPRRVEAMRRAVELDVDPHRWVKVQVQNVN